MSSTTDAPAGSNRASRKPDAQRIARSVVIAGAFLTAAWVVAVILLTRWLIVTIF